MKISVKEILCTSSFPVLSGGLSKSWLPETCRLFRCSSILSSSPRNTWRVALGHSPFLQVRAPDPSETSMQVVFKTILLRQYPHQKKNKAVRSSARTIVDWAKEERLQQNNINLAEYIREMRQTQTFLEDISDSGESDCENDSKDDWLSLLIAQRPLAVLKIEKKTLVVLEMCMQ